LSISSVSEHFAEEFLLLTNSPQNIVSIQKLKISQISASPFSSWFIFLWILFCVEVEQVGKKCPAVQKRELL
jgi:hypothetical protein